MGAFNPFSVLVGPFQIYLAIYGTAEPDVDTDPSSLWVRMAGSVDDQEIEYDSEFEHFTDNDHQAPVAGVRGTEMVTLRFTTHNLTYEHQARILSDIGNLQTGSTAAGGTTKILPIKRGYLLTAYAMLLKGQADSPYGLYPGQYYIPKCVSVSNPTVTRSKTARAMMPAEFVIYEDDLQSAGNEMGWTTAQTG